MVKLKKNKLIKIMMKKNQYKIKKIKKKKKKNI
jgi:hypothetical protein